MKIKLHVVISGQSIHEQLPKPTISFDRKFEITIEIDLIKDNVIEALLERTIVVGKKPKENFLSVLISDIGRQPIDQVVNIDSFCKETQTLEGKVVSSKILCNGYIKDLVADGWKELI